MARAGNEVILRWLLSMYRAARETPESRFKDETFRRLGELIPLSSLVWSCTGATRAGELTYLGLHMFQEPDFLADELPDANRKYTQPIDMALEHPRTAHSFYPFGMYAGREQAELRNYLTRFGHQNLLLLFTGPRMARKESFAVYRSRHDDHFTTSEQRLLELLAPHMTEAFAINRKLAGEAARGEVGTAGTRAIIQMNGVLVTCGPQFLMLLRRCWPDWDSARLPAELMRELRLGAQSLATKEGVIELETRKLGPYLFVEAGPSRGPTLSAREAEIGALYALGRTHRRIADEIGLQPATVRNVLQNVYKKLGVGNKAELVLALREQCPAS
jgi:DNA-binding CsgD family transcriptional regulator